MKRLQITKIACSIILMAGTVVFATNRADEMSRPERWKKVDEAQQKGLPATAIKELDLIYDSAVKDKAYPEAIKALTQKFVFGGAIEGNKADVKIVKLKEMIDQSPEEMRAVLDAVLAHWYWQYFQQERWRFSQRTQTQAKPGDDFTTWDLPRILSEIDLQFAKSLASEDVLKKIKISEYDSLLEKGELDDKYRPTLYDFVAWEALNFYQAGEQAGAKAQDSFEIDSNSPIFGKTADFIKWAPETTDTNSPKVKAIKLLQKLLLFHEKETDKFAFHDVEIARIRFGQNSAVGEEKVARYKASLKEFIDLNADHEMSAYARFFLAQQIFDEGEYVEAKKICDQAVNTFPQGRGGLLAYNLIQQIKAKNVQFNTERVWNDPWPVVRVSYRNIDKVYFRAFKIDWEKRFDANSWRPEQFQEQDRVLFKSGKPEAEWVEELTPTEDFKQREEDAEVPKTLKPGFYFIVASATADFDDQKQNGPLSYCPIWVSDLALINRQGNYKNQQEGFLLNNKTGEPVANARLKTWKRDNRNNKLIVGPEGKTDEKGRYSLTLEPNTSWILLAEKDEQKIAEQNDMYFYRQGVSDGRSRQVTFFTDRAIYRPGQTIKFKGIASLCDINKNQYEVAAKQKLTIFFMDVNGKEVSKLNVDTNEFGSFNGSFTAPRDRLMGQMMLQVRESMFNGNVAVRVEEYKRPQFEVTLQSPKEAIKLADAVKMPGKAMAYTGAAIGGAKVVYRVVREVRYPAWWYGFYYWRAQNQGQAQEISNGVTTTNIDGTFTINFTAKPDLSVLEKDEPRFNYHVIADVTDTTGETRSEEKSITLGYTALVADLTAESYLTSEKPVTLKVLTSSPNGDKLAAKGTVTINALKQPEKVLRSNFFGSAAMAKNPRQPRIRGRGPIAKPVVHDQGDPADPRSWAVGDVVQKLDFNTNAEGIQELQAKLPEGIYRATLETQDAFGKPVKAITQLLVVKPGDGNFKVRIPNYFDAENWTLEPGQELNAIWGTGYEKGRALVEVYHRGKELQSFWTDGELTQKTIKQAITEEMRGGITVQVVYVRENRAYVNTRKVEVPWSNKDLTIKWERFTSKLEPNQKETWTAVISGKQAKRTAIEMVAGLYDASLEQFVKHSWQDRFSFYQEQHQGYFTFTNNLSYFNNYGGWWAVDGKHAPNSYRHFPYALTQSFYGYMFEFGDMKTKMRRGAGPAGFAGGEGRAEALGAPAPAAMMKSDSTKELNQAQVGDKQEKAAGNADQPPPGDNAPKINLDGVSPRKNLDETAFFLPHLMTEENGQVKLTFQMPEAVTKWKFLGFAHDQQLRHGMLSDEIVTAKDLMVRPNAPRFMREGDILEFTLKVSNQSPTTQKGIAKLQLKDARNDKPINDIFGLSGEQPFEIAAKESKTLSWKLKVPDGQGPIIYTAIAGTDRISDGEEGMLAVLSRRVLVSESLPLPIRGQQEKEFEFKKLLQSANSDTIKHQSLTVQMVSQPAWYAVLALPYLMEYQHECSEQTFNRMYANMLAQHIANKDPKIRRIFNVWKEMQPDALKSPLHKNQDLKSVMIEETPWLRDGDKESEARKNVGILFDEARLKDEVGRGLAKLRDMQNADGLWPWFPGGRSNEYISLYIMTGFGRMRHLGVKIDTADAQKALDRLDAWMNEKYVWIKTHSKNPEDSHLDTTIAIYLYGRSFFIEDKAVAQQNVEALNYWKRQAKNHWLKLGHRQSQAHIALGMQRFGDRDTAVAILNSIKERSVSNEEMGMFWRDTEQSWWWYRAPIETQAVMIELFDEVGKDQKAVEDCKVWLLKQKQTQNWKTTKATADAVYGLLLRGDNLLSSDALVEVKLGENPIKPENVEAGTGFYQEKFTRTEVKPEMGKITLKKTDAGVSWGSVHWQYLEDISKVTPHSDAPLKLEKKLFRKVNTKKGPELQEVKDSVEVGDEVVVRVVLKSDRDLEYVHMKDHRGSGTEPVNVLSSYKFQDGLAYYESTKDTASHFFIDYLPKGTYVFEYSVRVQLRGEYQTGFADIQCMYAPEFNSHSESIGLKVK